MKILTIFVLTAALLIFLTSCGVVKEGFGSSEINQSNNTNDNEIKTLISNTENKNGNELQNKKVNKNLKETLLEKIKQN